MAWPALLTPGVAARTLNLLWETTRQYFKSQFIGTGPHKQSELVALILQACTSDVEYPTLYITCHLCNSFDGPDEEIFRCLFRFRYIEA